MVALLSLAVSPMALAQNSGPAPASTVLTYPEAPMPNPDVLIPPPHQIEVMPSRADGQRFQIYADQTVNLTDAMNRYSYNPASRGLNIVPFEDYWVSERITRLMALWTDYDEFSLLHHWNGFHKFFEKWSGYGP
jgi:hypothetical protein